MGILRQIKSILHNNDLPATQTQDVAEKTDRRRQRRRVHRGRKILIIDDSATIVAALGKILRSAGCIVLEAFDAEQGIDLARREKPDLIFLDIVLPGMNGFAALRQMRRDVGTQRIPIIMISGNEQATEQFYAKRIGADDFMKKPFSRHEIFSRTDALVATGRLPQLETPAASLPHQDLSVDQLPATAPVSAQSPGSRNQTQARIARTDQETAHLTNETVAGMSSLEARRQLTALGLQYFSQEQFSAAIRRGDRLAVDLFIIAGAVEVKA